MCLNWISSYFREFQWNVSRKTMPMAGKISASNFQRIRKIFSGASKPLTLNGCNKRWGGKLGPIWMKFCITSCNVWSSPSSLDVIKSIEKWESKTNRSMRKHEWNNSLLRSKKLDIANEKVDRISFTDDDAVLWFMRKKNNQHIQTHTNTYAFTHDKHIRNSSSFHSSVGARGYNDERIFFHPTLTHRRAYVVARSRTRTRAKQLENANWFGYTMGDRCATGWMIHQQWR